MIGEGKKLDLGWEMKRAERRRRLDEQEDSWRNEREEYRESDRRYGGEGVWAQRDFGGGSRDGYRRRYYSSGQNPDRSYNQWENQGGSYGRQSQRSDPDYSRRNFGNPYESEFDRGYGYGSSEGPFRGRGPSGWRRSDERITETINERLEEHGQIDADAISVTVKEGEVTLSAKVNSKTEKRLAELVAESCSGVKDAQRFDTFKVFFDLV